LGSRAARGRQNQNQPAITNYEKLREALLQDGEREAAGLFRQMMKAVVRLGLLDAINEEVAALCGLRYRPDRGSDCRRAGSERGVAYLDG
jgi:putative transposase